MCINILDQSCYQTLNSLKWLFGEQEIHASGMNFGIHSKKTKCLSLLLAFVTFRDYLSDDEIISPSFRHHWETRQQTKFIL